MHGVVVGVRDAGGRWLMVRRSTTVTAPLKVCFPGGAIEVGESQEAAVVREMREELGIDVKPVRCVWRHEFPERNIVLWGWLAELVSTDLRPDPAEIAEVFRKENNLPLPRPVPPEPASYAQEDVYSMLTEIASSSWDSIYATASGPAAVTVATAATTRARGSASAP